VLRGMAAIRAVDDTLATRGAPFPGYIVPNTAQKLLFTKTSPPHLIGGVFWG